jgi:tyrosyl-tRNA synthetase
MTTLVHGARETGQIKAASAALFGGGALTDLDGPTLAAALREAGSTEVSAAEGIPSVVDLFVAAGLSKSKGEARRTVGEGGAYLNNQRVEDPEQVPSRDDLLGGSWLVLRRGKKHLAGVEVVG